MLMPFIKKSKRESIDSMLSLLISQIENDAPAISYVMLRLLMDGFDNNIEGYIKALGTIEETKLTYYNFVFAPTEQLILAKRWMDGNGEWKHE